MTKAFSSIYEAHDDHIMVVDALNLAFRYKHTNAVHFMDDYIRTIESLARSYHCSKVIIACDSGSSSYRKEIYPDYKIARKEKFEKQTEEEREEFEQFFREFSETIDKLNTDKRFLVLKFDRCEADDIAAYICKLLGKSYTIWLMSSDKDWDLLISDNINRFSYVTRKEITKENWSEHYEYDVDSHISIKCLTGDSGDSIPGVSGIGPKKAMALVQQYGTTMDIIANMPIVSKYKHIQNLNQFGVDALMRNYQLMDLQTFCEDALGEENCKIIQEKLVGYLFNE